MGSACGGNKLEEYDIIPPLSDDDIGFYDVGSRLRPGSAGSFAGRPGGITEEYWNSHIAAAKAMTLLQRKEGGHCTIDQYSVYGAAIALPQLARTSGWSLRYTGLVIRGYVSLVLNILLQGFLLYMLSKEERIMAKFSGKMSLCDFGAQLYTCPEGLNCRGPGGTEITPERLYSWDTWSTRVFVRDSLKIILPEKAAEIDAQIDPGEYGVESYYLRMTCCFIFVLGLWPDLIGSSDMVYLLYHAPTKAMPWMIYEKGSAQSDKKSISPQKGVDTEECVRFQVNGMPLQWKIFNFFMILLPKIYIWFLTADIGIVFLLETSSIEEMIINAVALNFILGIDETLCSALMSPMVKYMLENMEDYALFDAAEQSADSEKEAFQRHVKDTTWSLRSPELYAQLVPPRLVVMFLITSFFICKYYTENCASSPDGGLVSTAVHMPKSSQMSFLSFLFGPFPNLFPVDVDHGVSLWEMPG